MSARKKDLNSRSSTASISNNQSPLDNLQQRIAVNAFYKAQSRGFIPGHELEDWLAAEAELNEISEEYLL